MPTILLALEDRLAVATGPDRRIETSDALAGHAPRALAAAGGAIFCATHGHGVWRSADGGRSWSRTEQDGLRDARVTAIAADGDMVLCGTEPSAVWRSDDAGVSWHPLPPLTTLPSAPEWSFPPRPDTHHVRALLIDPYRPERCYVAVEAGALVRTLDGGATWIDRADGAPRDTHTLRLHPLDSGRLYAAAGDGYFESRDHGATWERPRNGLDHHYMWSVAAHPRHAELRVVSAAAGPRQAHDAASADARLYRRTRLSEWEPCAVGLPPAAGTTAYVLRNDPVEPDGFWLACNHGVYRSVNAGESWTRWPADWPAALARQRVADLLII